MKVCSRRSERFLFVHFLLIIFFASHYALSLVNSMGSILEAVNMGVRNAIMVDPQTSVNPLGPVIVDYIAEGLMHALTGLPETLQGQEATTLSQSIDAAAPKLHYGLVAALGSLGIAPLAKLTSAQISTFTQQVAQAIEEFVTALNGGLLFKKISFNQGIFSTSMQDLANELNTIVATQAKIAS